MLSVNIESIFYESLEFFCKSKRLVPVLWVSGTPRMTFLSITNRLFLIDERSHTSSTLPDSVNIHYLCKVKHRDRCILQGTAAAARKTLSLCQNTEAKSDKPSHTSIHLLSFVPCFAACLGINDTECHSLPLVIQVFFSF